jgi:hypothetical protein
MHAPYISLPGRKIRLDEDRSLCVLKNVLNFAGKVTIQITLFLLSEQTQVAVHTRSP